MHKDPSTMSQALQGKVQLTVFVEVFVVVLVNWVMVMEEFVTLTLANPGGLKRVVKSFILGVEQLVSLIVQFVSALNVRMISFPVGWKEVR